RLRPARASSPRARLRPRTSRPGFRSRSAPPVACSRSCSCSACAGADVFDHVTIRASDREASERFYETVLKTLELEQTYSGEHFAEWGDFSLAQATGEKPVTRRLHIGFVAPRNRNVDEFWRVGTEAGYRDEGEPRPAAAVLARLLRLVPARPGWVGHNI